MLSTKKKHKKEGDTGRKITRRPVVAPGMTDYLELEATEEEIKRGDYTLVTRLSYDEVED